MSTWTSKVLGPALCLSLAACVAGGAGTVRFGPPEGPGFAVAAPSGFCTARDSLSRLGTSDFVAFTRCSGAGPVLTATVGAPGSGAGVDLSGAALAAYFTSAEGRAALSRSGRAEAVTVHEVLEAEGAVLVRLTDASRRPSEIGAGDKWRAVLAVQDRLVTLAAAPGRGGTLGRDAGRALIGRYVAATRAANGG